MTAVMEMSVYSSAAVPPVGLRATFVSPAPTLGVSSKVDGARSNSSSSGASTPWKIMRERKTAEVASGVLALLSAGTCQRLRVRRRKGLEMQRAAKMQRQAAKDKEKEQSDKDGDSGGLNGVKDWIDRKKSEASGGAGGAVVGGMLMGPLGAVVGANIGSRIMPEVDKVLKEWEKDVDEAPGAERVAPPPPARKAPPREVAPRPPSVKSPASDLGADRMGASVAEASPRREASPMPAAPRRAAPPPAARPQRSTMDFELSELKAGVKVKRAKLEDEVAKLTEEAEAALKAGAEDKARELLVERAAARKSLEQLLEGERAHLAKAEEQCASLEAQCQDLYKKASKALEAGDEALARDILEKREQAKAELATAQQKQAKLSAELNN